MRFTMVNTTGSGRRISIPGDPQAMKQAAGLWDEKTIQAKWDPTFSRSKSMDQKNPSRPPCFFSHFFFTVHFEVWETRETCNLSILRNTFFWILIVIGFHFLGWWNHVEKMEISDRFLNVQSWCCEKFWRRLQPVNLSRCLGMLKTLLWNEQFAPCN